MTDASLFDEQPEPIRPYWQDDEPSSGWSGSDTSKETEPVRLQAQQRVWLALREAGPKGLTWAEAAAQLNLDPRYEGSVHHGTASGALSNLHKVGHAARLTEKRMRRKVYVLPHFIDDRPTEPPTVKLSRKELAKEAWFAALVHRGDYSEPVEKLEAAFEEWWTVQ